MKNLKLFSVILMLLVGIGQVWADPSTYTWTLASGDLGTAETPATSVSKGSPATTWSVAWTWRDDSKKYLGFEGSSSARGLQIGKGTANYGGTTVVLSTSGISGTITSVKVNAAIAGSGNAELSVTVGSDDFEYNSETVVSLTTSATEYEFEGSASGDISISLVNKATGKGMYLKSIEVTYSTGGGSGKDDLTDGQLSWSAASANITFGDEPYSLPSLTNSIPVSVTYESTAEAVATISNVGAVSVLKAGSTTIKAVFAGNDDYNAKTVSYTLTVAPAPLTPIAGGIVDELKVADFGVTGGYTAFTDKQASNTGHSDAVYAGTVARNGNATQYNIQLNSGQTSSKLREIVTSTSGGYAKRVQAIWATQTANVANRKLTVYGSESAYTGSETAATGTKIGDLTYTSGDAYAYIDIDGDYPYIQIVANGAIYMDQINVTWVAPDVSKVATPQISGTANFYPSTSVSITCGTENAAIYYTTDGTTPTSASTPYEGAFTVNADGTTTVKAIAVKDGMTDSDVAEQTFTKITPISVAAALENIDALSNNGTIPNQYVKGLISEIVQYNSGNTITYYISDDGSTTSQLQVYKGSAGVANGGNPFTSETDLKVGEEVVVFGTLKKFKSGSNPVVPEFVNPNEIVAYKPHSPLAWSANAYTAELTGENTFPALSGTAGLTITYSSSDATKASFADASVYEITLNAVTGEDPVTITVSSAATDDYVATSVSYALTIQESVVRYTLDYVCNEATSGCPETTHLTDQTNVPSPLPTVAKDGKNFGGWYLESTFENLATAGDPLTGNTTLYAQWLEPYTVAQALTMIDALADNGTTGNVYVAGVVTDDEVEVASNVATYYIKDAGESNSLMVYKGNGLGNTSVSEGDILESDQVVVYGALKKYVKNTTKTPEIVNPNYIYSRVRPTTEVTGVTLPATAIVRVGSTITLTPTIAPNNATNKNVSWSVISGNTYAEVSDAGVVTGLIADGDAVIQVETEDGGFTATCTVSVAAARPTFTEDDHEWIKVTNASKLIAGRYYVIASETKGKTAKNTISSNRLDQVASTFEDGRISVTNLGTNTAIFELGGVSEAWTLNEVTNEANTGLLSYNADKKVEWAGTNTTWDISIENGNATIAAVSASTERILHNNNSSWFTVYASATSSSMLLPQLYMWAELSHSVTFDANGGVAESVPAVERTDEGKIIIPATVPTHSDVSQKFDGWYAEAAPATLYNAGDEFATDADVTLYAKWNTVPTYTVSYDANGGTGTAPAEPATVIEGATITVLDNTFTNPGFAFEGWMVTYNDGEEKVIEPDDNSQFPMPAYNVVIKAVWGTPSNQKWVLVTDVAELEAGKKYVIVAAGDKEYAMSTTQNNNNRGQTAIAKSGNQMSGTNSMQIITLEGTTGAWEFNVETGYLYAASSTSNWLRTQTTNNDNGKWTISISSDGEGVTSASIVANGENTRKVLRYNSSNKIFSCYASSSNESPVAIYREKELTQITTNGKDEDDVQDGNDVEIGENVTWTVSSEKTVGDVFLKEGAIVDNSATLHAQNLYFKTKAGKSNQIMDVSSLDLVEDLYYDIQLCSGTLDADYWYCIAVPFDVDIQNGVFLADGTQLTFGTDYEVWIFDPQKRAETQANGWKRISDKMQAGRAYLIGFNPGMPNTVRLKAAAGWKDHLFSGPSIPVESTTTGAAGRYDNWNGIANPTMKYIGINTDVQVFNNDTHQFDPQSYDKDNYNYVVGTPFFVQATSTSVDIEAADNEQFRAPKRDALEVEKYSNCVRIARAEAETYDNQIIVRASEEATSDYQAGHDMLTLNNTTSKTSALLWTENYGGLRLAIEEAPLVNNSAAYTLGIYAPADGDYSISADQDDASIYLTYEGRVIWDLTVAPYTLSLTKGNTAGYGLRIIAAPRATTDIDNIYDNASGVQKIMLNNSIFILRGEQMYDATGRMIK